MTQIQQQIQEEWDKSLCPLVNGILSINGLLVSFEVNNGEDRLTVTKQGSHLLEKVECFVEVDISSTLIHEGARFGCGASSMGDEGFFYCSAKGILMWIGFFQGSNPFIDIRMEKGLAVITNNWGNSLQFSPFDPLSVEAR